MNTNTNITNEMDYEAENTKSDKLINFTHKILTKNEENQDNVLVNNDKNSKNNVCDDLIENKSNLSEISYVNCNKFSFCCDVNISNNLKIENDTRNNSILVEMSNVPSKLTNSTPTSINIEGVKRHVLNSKKRKKNGEDNQDSKKKRRTKDIQIPVSDEHLREYCINAVKDFPKNGIIKKCNICNNEYDINVLFKDNRIIDDKLKYICLYCSISVDVSEIKDWNDEYDKKRVCKRCKTRKSDKKYKKPKIKYCMYCSLKKNRHYGRYLIGLEKINNKNKKVYDNDEPLNKESVNSCYV